MTWIKLLASSLGSSLKLAWAGTTSKEAESVSTDIEGFDNVAHNRTRHEDYKAELRQNMEKPIAQDPVLGNIVKELYKPNAKIGSGSTADAIREEAATGNQVGGKYHFEKGENFRRGLLYWLEDSPTATLGDRAIAENLLQDLNDAMGYVFRWYTK